VLHKNIRMRYLKTLGITTVCGMAIGLIIAFTRQPDAYGYLLAIRLSGMVCLFSGLFGGAVCRLVRWRCRQIGTAKWIGGVLGFLLTPTLFWLLVIGIDAVSRHGHGMTDGSSLALLFGIIFTALPLGVIGAVFAVGAGQD
jgi:hypothetical protein